MRNHKKHYDASLKDKRLIKEINELKFWQKPKNPTLKELVGFFPQMRIFVKIPLSVNNLVLPVFEPYDPLTSHKISEKYDELFLR